MRIPILIIICSLFFIFYIFPVSGELIINNPENVTYNLTGNYLLEELISNWTINETVTQIVVSIDGNTNISINVSSTEVDIEASKLCINYSTYGCDKGGANGDHIYAVDETWDSNSWFPEVATGCGILYENLSNPYTGIDSILLTSYLGSPDGTGVLRFDCYDGSSWNTIKDVSVESVSAHYSYNNLPDTCLLYPLTQIRTYNNATGTSSYVGSIRENKLTFYDYLNEITFNDTLSGYHNITLWAYNRSSKWESVTIYFTIDRLINITFDENTNATLTYSTGGNISLNTDEIIYYVSEIPEGITSITFNDDLQLLEFYNSINMTEINYIHVTDTPDKVQDFTVWDRYAPVEDANVFIYELVADDTFYLIWSSFTENQGIGSANLVSGKEYLFNITADSYNILTELRYIVPGADDTLNFVLVEEGEETGTVTPYTDCPATIITPQSCSIYVSTTIDVTRIDFDWLINGTSTGSATVNNTNYAELQLTVNETNYNYTVNASVNNELVGTWFIEYGNVSARDNQITVSPINVASEDYGTFAMLVMVLCGAFAGIGNEIVKGTGIYIYGIILTIFSAISGAFLFGGVAVGIIIIITVSRRLL